MTTDISSSWENLLDTLDRLIGKRPVDLNAVLFLIGVQELGRGPKRFSKEQKQDLLHVAVCTVLTQAGYYKLSGRDKDDWPQFDLVKPLPVGDILVQEDLLKTNVLRYFQSLLTEA
jgi:hypothetical protein